MLTVLAWWFWLNTTNDAPRLSLKTQNNLRDIKNTTVLLIAEVSLFQLFWTIAFGLFIYIYSKMFFQKRVDGSFG
jgi:hypothetical protein